MKLIMHWMMIKKCLFLLFVSVATTYKIYQIAKRTTYGVIKYRQLTSPQFRLHVSVYSKHSTVKVSRPVQKYNVKRSRDKN